MDGSCNVKTAVNELQSQLQHATTLATVRTVVRTWATQHGYMPCVAKPTVDGLEVFYNDVRINCLKVVMTIPADVLLCLQAEYEAGFSGW